MTTATQETRAAWTKRELRQIEAGVQGSPAQRAVAEKIIQKFYAELAARRKNRFATA